MNDDLLLPEPPASPYAKVGSSVTSFCLHIVLLTLILPNMVQQNPTPISEPEEVVEEEEPEPEEPEEEEEEEPEEQEEEEPEPEEPEERTLEKLVEEVPGSGTPKKDEPEPETPEEEETTPGQLAEGELELDSFQEEERTIEKLVDEVLDPEAVKEDPIPVKVVAQVSELGTPENKAGIEYIEIGFTEKATRVSPTLANPIIVVPDVVTSKPVLVEAVEPPEDRRKAERKEPKEEDAPVKIVALVPTVDAAEQPLPPTVEEADAPPPTLATRDPQEPVNVTASEPDIAPQEEPPVEMAALVPTLERADPLAPLPVEEADTSTEAVMVMPDPREPTDVATPEPDTAQTPPQAVPQEEPPIEIAALVPTLERAVSPPSPLFGAGQSRPPPARPSLEDRDPSDGDSDGDGDSDSDGDGEEKDEASKSNLNPKKGISPEDFRNQVLARISRVAFPPTGFPRTPVIEFSVDARGNLESVILIRRSGNIVLDRVAQRLIEVVSPFPKPPDEAKNRTFRISLSNR